MKRVNVVKVIALITMVWTASVAWADDNAIRGNAEVAQSKQLVGAWSLTQIPEEGGPPPFAMLMVFNRDGGVVETDAGPPNPLQFSPGIGEWKHTNSGYVVNYTQLQYDDGQNHIGIFKGHLEITVDDEKGTLTGTVRVRFLDTNETLLFEGFGTVEGKRIPFE